MVLLITQVCKHDEDVIPIAPKVSLNIKQMMKQSQKSETSMPQFTLKHQTSGWTIGGKRDRYDDNSQRDTENTVRT